MCACGGVVWCDVVVWCGVGAVGWDVLVSCVCVCGGAKVLQCGVVWCVEECVVVECVRAGVRVEG